MPSLKNFLKSLKSKEPEWIIHPEVQSYHPQTSQLPEDYTVEIVNRYDEDGRWCGSYIEPALSSILGASDLDTLRWKAACVNAAHPELQIRITEGYHTIEGVRQSGEFHIATRSQSTSCDFNSTWSILTGMEVGADIIKDVQKESNV